MGDNRIGTGATSQASGWDTQNTRVSAPDGVYRRDNRHRQDPSRRRHRPRLHPNGHPWPLLQRRRPGQPPRGQTPRRTPGPHRGPAQLKAVLRQIDPDDDNLFHGRPFPHLGVDNTANLAHRDADGRGTTPSLTVRSFKFPDPRINVPVRVLNFPVMFCREFTGKPLVSSGLPPITGPNSPIFVKIPCIFPDYQGIGAETGSQQTAPTAAPLDKSQGGFEKCGLAQAKGRSAVNIKL